METDDSLKIRSRFLGCLLGGAVGDALGYPVEFLNENDIFRKYGPAGIRELRQAGHPARISDDTQMTLFTANGLLYADSCGVSPIECLAAAYGEWLGTQGDTDRMKDPAHPRMWLYGVPALHALRAPGNTCLSAIRSDRFGEPASNNSKGCGAVMRAAPLGLHRPCGAASDSDGRETEAARLGSIAGAMTHGHPMGYGSAALLAAIIAMLVHLREARGFQTLQEAILAAPGNNDALLHGAARAVSLALDPAVPDLDGVHACGAGWTGDEALFISIFCAVRHQNDFGAAIRCAVNHGGDSDSTGAVTGNILGAWLGIDAVHGAFDLRDLELCGVVEEIALDLYRAWRTGIPENDGVWNRKYRPDLPGSSPRSVDGM